MNSQKTQNQKTTPKANEGRRSRLIRTFRVDSWLLQRFALFTYWVDAGPGGLGWNSQDKELKRQYEDVLAWITRTIMPKPGSSGIVAGTPIRTWDDGSIWVIETGRDPKKIGTYPNTEPKVLKEGTPAPERLNSGLSFPCPRCQSNDVVGQYQSAWGSWPDGWHLACGSCKTSWFLTIKLNPNR
jgi:hypothetical protein